jgi:hypothetical protein
MRLPRLLKQMPDHRVLRMDLECAFELANREQQVLLLDELLGPQEVLVGEILRLVRRG